MALPSNQIKSMIEQLHAVGDDGVAFDAWMGTVAPYVRAHADVGKFRTEARANWLTGNKKGVEVRLKEILSKPNKAEQAALDNGGIPSVLENRVFNMVLVKLGIHKGDTLTVHTKHGETKTITFDQEGLPERPEPSEEKSKSQLLHS